MCAGFLTAVNSSSSATACPCDLTGLSGSTLSGSMLMDCWLPSAPVICCRGLSRTSQPDQPLLQQCKVFKSARSPIRLVFNCVPTALLRSERTACGEDNRDGDASPPARQPGGSLQAPLVGPEQRAVQLLFKSGDDLRQDQFVCQVRSETSRAKTLAGTATAAKQTHLTQACPKSCALPVPSIYAIVCIGQHRPCSQCLLKDCMACGMHHCVCMHAYNVRCAADCGHG